MFLSGIGVIMDNEETVRKVTRKILERIGYEVVTVKNFSEVIKLYRQAKDSQKPFDIVIMDLTVPGGKGGKEVIKKLFEIDPGVKAILSSGFTYDPIILNFDAYGFCATISKPYNMEELREILHKVIHESN